VFELILENLATKDGDLIIGISEVKNSNNLGTNDLLEIAKALSKSVLAFQFFNSMMIVDEMHLLSSAQNAVYAMIGEYMISRSLDVELVVYSSAQHQIGIALDIMGVKNQLGSIAVVCIDEDEKKVRKCLADVIETVGEEVAPMFSPTAKKISSLMETFDISEQEMKQFTNATDLVSRSQALSKCVVSRVSMVSLVS
jgi:tRNA threonylcarbamoyladenosine modification (KEOPS) complex Cgi121 subunit